MLLEPILGCRTEVKANLAAWKLKAEELEELEKADATKSWRNFVAKASLQGAGKGHAWTKAPTAWTPTVTIKTDGTVTADSRELMLAERCKWKEE